MLSRKSISDPFQSEFSRRRLGFQAASSRMLHAFTGGIPGFLLPVPTAQAWPDIRNSGADDTRSKLRSTDTLARSKSGRSIVRKFAMRPKKVVVAMRSWWPNQDMQRKL
ncbi:hypothetical protein HNQ71_000223 [Mesorhizobium sangaii]|uniref:Uncharacterized protein n=2 Tax=Mesorhizobium sangaii TaxID=505389 RepID=A0A841PCH5_9HYPH|nr:hypothetical protein [Mesorhizobium sangaii]